MDPSSIRQIVILLILLLLSAFFSSAETALTTVNKHRMRALANQGNKKAARVLALIEKPEKMLSAILIGNNIVNLSASSLTTTLAMSLASQAGLGKNTSTFVGLATGILTLLILIFGEITPKTIATMKNESMALLYSGIIYTITTVLTPVIYVVNLFSGLLCRLFGIKPGSGQAITELELRTIVDVSQESGVIEKEEKELINNVFDFGDSVAKDIMLPRIDVSFASVDMSYDELVEIFLEEQYSRLPVYEESKDNVIGILNLKDLFFYRETHRNEAFDIYKVLREPFFTYEYQKNFYTSSHYALLSIFRNLFVNALEASKTDTVNLSVTEVIEDGQAIFTVTDDGPGIPAEYIGEVFKTGFSTKINFQTGEVSRGLGLNLVQGELHGTIGLTSIPGRTVFTICIPLNELEVMSK